MAALEKVAPVKSSISNSAKMFSFGIAPQSGTVLRMKAN